MDFDPEVMAAAERYKLLIGGVVPRPIAFVSTVGVDGSVNLAPFSFFNAIGSDPMMMMFCPANTAGGGEKDSLRNAKPAAEGGQGEFVVNIVPYEIRKQMAACAEPLGYGESEWKLSGLTAAASKVVKPARVAECHLAFECRTVQVIRTNPGVPAGGNIVIGRVVYVWAAEGVVSERFHVDAARLDAIGRMGGLQYCTSRERFEVPMGRKALEERN